MNTYRWADLQVGMTHEFEVVIEQAMLDRFLANTGDVNPLHTNAEFARARGFPDAVVYGMLTASFYSTLVGVYLPGQNALLHGVDVSFLKPVFPGDRLLVSGKIKYLNDAYRQVEISATIKSGGVSGQPATGQKVSHAKIKVGVHE